MTTTFTCSAAGRADVGVHVSLSGYAHGGRLQRLWLARGGAGGGKMTGAAERRLRRLAAMRVNEWEDGAGDDGGAPESAAS